jgi:hypothetical protein
MREFPKLMGMGDVMKYLKVSRQYVDFLVDTGKMRCQHISTGKVFLKSDVAAFERKRQHKAKQRQRKRRRNP